MNKFSLDVPKGTLPLLAAMLSMAAGCGPMAVGDGNGSWHWSGVSVPERGVASQGRWGGTSQGGSGVAPSSFGSGDGAGGEAGGGRKGADTGGGCRQPPCVVVVNPQPSPSPPIKPTTPDLRAAPDREAAVKAKREALAAPDAVRKANGARPLMKSRPKGLEKGAAIGHQ